MTAAELLAELSQRGVRLFPEGRNLRFRAPKGALTAELRELLVQRKPEVLAMVRQRLGEHAESHPLSYGQAALWFLHQDAPESVAYTVAFLARMESAVDIAALRDACQALIDRHGSLRTTYAGALDDPAQHVHGHVDVCVEHADASTWSHAQLDERVMDAYRRPFDLTQGPLFRVSVFGGFMGGHILLLTAHHIAVDGWSVALLLEELRALYAAQRAGAPSSLPLPGAEYVGHVRQQRELLQGAEGDRLWRYWQSTMAGELPVLNLQTDRSRPPVRALRGASHFCTLDEGETKRIRDFAAAEGVTLYMLFLAVFQTLLHRYTGQDDVLVGSPVAGRNQAESERTVGYFVNMVALRGDASGNPRFREFLGRTRTVVLGALAHQDYPFALLVEKLVPDRDTSRTPIFQVAFGFLGAQITTSLPGMAADEGSRAAAGSAALRLEPLPLPQQEGLFDITFEVRDAGARLDMQLKYDTALFDRTTIERMAGHFRMMLDSVIGDPDQRLGDLTLLTDAERHQLLTTWNDTAAPYPHDQCIHELFERQAARTPDALALGSPQGTLSYGELNRRANQLAHYLRGLGIAPDVPVGVCVARSLDYVVGVLGVLKAGGAYVPLDPEYPSERLSFMLQDAGIPVLLTQARVASMFPSERTQMVRLDADWERIARESEENPQGRTASAHLAYVIYTSGSTGRPKGVELEHRGLVNLVTWHQHAHDVTSKDRATLLAGLGFDASVWELWPYLTAGASIHIPEDDIRASPPDLIAWLAAERVTISFLVTPLLEAMIELDWRAGMALRVVLTGGDRLHRAPHKTLPFMLANHYGPTEYTVVTTWGLVNVGGDLDAPPPIGRPIANTKVYLVDRRMQPVPVGMPGELCVAGVGLARGYVNNPDLTAEKFVIDPFSRESASRLYRTGDLARYLPDGRIEFLGRADEQVKLRGFRVELGEIEAALERYHRVRQAVVVARSYGPEDSRLVAYVVGEPGLSTDELRAHLQTGLPDYMVPALYVLLERLPLTPNGKVDRRALPAPDAASVSLERYVAPRTPLEEAVAQIWIEVLKVERVGVHDNFFRLGGHSLLMAQVAARLRRALQLELPIRAYFENPTLGGVAAALDAVRTKRAEDVSQCSQPIPRVSRVGRVFRSGSPAHDDTGTPTARS